MTDHRRCEVCGGALRARTGQARSWQRYCSQRCRMAAYRERRHQTVTVRPGVRRLVIELDRSEGAA